MFQLFFCENFNLSFTFIQVKSVRRRPVSRSTTSKAQSKVTEMYNIELMRQEINIDDHKIPLEDLFYRLMTDPHTGLSAAQVLCL